MSIRARQDEGGTTIVTCQMNIQDTGDAWNRASEGDYPCAFLVSTGVGN